LPKTTDELNIMTNKLKDAFNASVRLNEIDEAIYRRNSFRVISNTPFPTAPPPITTTTVAPPIITTPKVPEYSVTFGIKFKVPKDWQSVSISITRALEKEVNLNWGKYKVVRIVITFTETAMANRYRRMSILTAADSTTSAPTVTLQAKVVTSFDDTSDTKPKSAAQFNAMVDEMKTGLEKDTSEIHKIDGVTYVSNSFEIHEGMEFKSGGDPLLALWIVLGLLLGGALIAGIALVVVRQRRQRNRVGTYEERGNPNALELQGASGAIN